MDEQILEESDDLNGIQWPRWYSELIHEMIHEYQKKVKPKISKEGKNLFKAYQISDSIAKSHNGYFGFDGQGHDEIYYSSLCILASYFKLTPEELKKRI